MSIKRASFPAEFKAIGDKGKVEAIVSVFGNVDRIGDRVMPGAFTKTIARWKASGDPVPVILSHDWSDVWSHIGVVDELEEVDKGLKATYTLDIDANPVAAQVYRLMKRRSLKEHSFGYEIKNERTAKDGANELTDLDLIEIGPTLKGMNSETELLAVKSALASVDVETKMYGTLAGSVEERQRLISDAVTEANGGGGERVWTWVLATFPDRVVYSRESNGEAAEYFEASYTIEGDVVSLGAPVSVELSTTVQAKAFKLKAGRRISRATESELSTLADEAESFVSRIRGLLSAGDSEKQNDDDEDIAGKSTAPPGEDDVTDNSEPDSDLLIFKTRIESMRK